MLKIRCTSLEDVRKNPLAYAQLLANGDARNGGGTHGMFAYWQDIAKRVHSNELTVSKGVKELQNKFIRFDDTPKNKAKQDGLLEQFVLYCNLFDKNEFALVDGRRQMKWELYAGVMLTGLTPLVVHNDKGYYSYMMTERPFDWQAQLRFPLMQQYLADYNINCDVAEINIGTYSLATSKFDFKCFTKAELNKSVIQTSMIFENVYSEYSKINSQYHIVH